MSEYSSINGFPSLNQVRSVARWSRTRPLFGAIIATILGSFSGHSETLVPTASTWRWRPGTSEASTPVDAWRLQGFADSQFVSAPAPFWYGDILADGTEIQGMRDVYGTLFLRKKFVVQNAAEISELQMTALVDDGFVAWINGVEVLRIGVPGQPGSPVNINTLAANAVEPVSFLPYALTTPTGYLQTGTNLLAVQVFQSSIGSSDLGFDASLESIARDSVPPILVKMSPSPGATVDTLETIAATFSEPVNGVVAAHLLINGVGARAVSTPDSRTYIFAFVQPAAGPITVRWHAGQTITDTAVPPNRFEPESPGNGGLEWRYDLIDRAPPMLSGLVPAKGATVRQLTSLLVQFSEPITGVDAGDLTINDQPATQVTPIAATEFLFAFPQPAPGLVQFAWSPNHGILDQAALPNAFDGVVSGAWTVRLDTNATADAPYISEFMASNTRTLRDDAREYSDWIELYNPSPTAVDLRGWSLTDDPGNLRKWRFPVTHLPGGGFLIVFASGADRRTPGAQLHTSFQLSANGEYLALVHPDGVTVASEFRPNYPVQIPDVSHGVIQIPRDTTFYVGSSGMYFNKPTPGAPNLDGTAVPGPVITAIQHTPRVPSDGEDLRVIARVRPTFHPVNAVTLKHRVMFGAESSVPMWDDGAHGDGAAGDQVYGATLPAALAAPGEMIRYKVEATDAPGTMSRWPLFPQPTTGPEYLGTVVQPTNFTTKLPVFQLFVAPTQLSRIDTETGGRVSLFHDGELYDNAYMELRGNTSAGLNKKSHRLEFNRGYELRHPGPGGRIRKSALLAEYLDPTYLRQHLCFWFLDQIGVPAPFHYPVRVQLNGQFYQLAFHNDVIGQAQVERLGYDPRGALYKAVGNLTTDFSSTGVFQKLEPDNDASRADYLQLASGIREGNSIANRRITVFDLLDLPEVINYLAGARWCAENDDVWANMSIYRDTFGDGLWRVIPFDMNASWGQLYGGSDPLEATIDSSKSHPLYGGMTTGGNYNRLYDVIVRLPETRQMLLRRERSILDQMVQPSDTPPNLRILENHIVGMTNLFAAEAALDRAKWGASPWAPNKNFTTGVNDIINRFIVPRRRHWYLTHSITNTARAVGINASNNAGIPLTQPDEVDLKILSVDFNPTSGLQAQEYIALTNQSSIAVDLTGWKLSGAVEFVFRPGTVVPSNSVIYVSPDIRQFRARTSGPRGGQGFFVVGPYRGQLSARGEQLELHNALGRVIHQFSYAGQPGLAQQFLRITEIHYYPAQDPAGGRAADDFEFLELRNIASTNTLDLSGVRLVEGIAFTFPMNALSRLEPGARLVVVASMAAFESRYGKGLPVAGEYAGLLDNSGERVRMVDATGEEVLDFEYSDRLDATDGEGLSLEVVDDFAQPGAWSAATQWRASGAIHGSPGTAAGADLPRLTATRSASEIVLQFPASPGRSYTVQVSDAIDGNYWQNLRVVPPQPSAHVVELREPLSQQRRLYRVVTVRP